MTSNEPPEAKAERLAEERADEEYHERRQWEELRRIYGLSEEALNQFMSNPTLLPLSKRPKSGKIKKFHITCEVHEEYWTALVKEGFKENDLPDMLADSICNIADQVEHGARESREMRFVTP